HHVILFRPHPGPVQWPPKNCPLTLNWDQWELLAPTQHPETHWKLPPGVAINTSRRQPLLVQTHYVRGSRPKTRHAMTKTKLYPIDPATVTAHAGALFLNDRSMVVPPHTRMTEVNRCTITGEGGQAREVKLLSITGHYHFRGLGFEAFRVHTDGSLGEELYKFEGFDQPNFKQFDDPPVLHPGEGIEWRCHYQNNSDKTYTYGPDATTQEHCILFGAYYPTSTVQEAINCTHDKDTAGHDVSTDALRPRAGRRRRLRPLSDRRRPPARAAAGRRGPASPRCPAPSRTRGSRDAAARHRRGARRTIARSAPPRRRPARRDRRGHRDRRPRQ